MLCYVPSTKRRCVRFNRSGVTIDTCYLCERKSTNEDDEAVLKKLLERDRKDPG
jgi:hypothetical protein